MSSQNIDLKKLACDIEETIDALSLPLDGDSMGMLVDTFVESTSAGGCAIDRQKLCLIVGGVIAKRKLQTAVALPQEVVQTDTAVVEFVERNDTQKQKKRCTNKNGAPKNAKPGFSGWFDGEGAMHRAFQRFETGSFVIARDSTEQGAKGFGILDTKQTGVEKFIMQHAEEKRTFYEVIPYQPDMNIVAPCKFFLDFDLKDLCLQHQRYDSEIHGLKMDIERLFEQAFDIQLDDKNFVILDSSYNDLTEEEDRLSERPKGKCKTSFHIIVQGYHFSNIQMLVRLTRSKLFDSIFPDQVTVDRSIYRNNSCFRLAKCTKMNKNHHLRLISEHAFEDSLVSVIPQDSTLIDDDLILKLNPYKEQDMSDKKQTALSDSTRNAIDRFILENIEHPYFKEIADKKGTLWEKQMYSFHNGGVSLDVWQQINALSSEYNERQNEKRWNTLGKTSEWMNEEKARKFAKRLQSELGIQIDVPELQFKSISQTDLPASKLMFDIAHHFASLFKPIAKYDSENDTIFAFDKRWRQDEVTLTLIVDSKYIPKFKMIYKELCEELEELYEKCVKLKDTTEIEKKIEKKERECKHVLEILEKMQYGFQKNMLGMIKTSLLERGFHKKMDVDTNLIGFENCVYDISTGQTKPYDCNVFITKTVCYDFPTECPYQHEIETFIEQVFPDPDVRHYMKKYLGSCIAGNNKHELMCFWTGLDSRQTGANGKSTLCTLLKLTLGDYYLPGNAALISSDRGDPKAPNPALRDFKNKRFIAFQEVEKRINMNQLKELTGNDTIRVRTLFKEPETFEPSWNIIVCCNNVPDLSSDEGGVRRRVRKIPFESKFVDNVHDEQYEGIPNVFPINTDLKNCLDKWKSSFMHLLIHWYHTLYVTEGLGYDTTPKKIKDFTDDLFNEQHRELFDWLDDKIVHCVLDPPVFIKLMDIRPHIRANVEKKYSTKELDEILKRRYAPFFKQRYQPGKRGKQEQHTNVIMHHNCNLFQTGFGF